MIPSLNQPFLCLTIGSLVVGCATDIPNEHSGSGGAAIVAGGSTNLKSTTGGNVTKTGTLASVGTNTMSSGLNTGGANTGGTNSRNAVGSGAGGSSAAVSTSSSLTVPPSCQPGGPGLTDCGQGESCCASLMVPGGTFYRTYANDDGSVQNTADPATISDFRLDKYLVTVARFRRFVQAWDQGSGYTPDPGSGKHTHLHDGRGLADSGAPQTYESGWVEKYSNQIDLSNDTLDCQSNLSTWTVAPGVNEKLPMNCINWFEAYAFCIWDGGFLASEAEYVYAAAGGSEQRPFPWGSIAPGKSNEYAIWGCYYPDGLGTCDGTTRNLAPVGTAKLGAGKWGQLDLVGNLIEWYLDWFAPSYSNPCIDCANLADGSGRAPRDGYFASTDEALLRSSSRNNGFYPANRFQSYGFRCARTP